MKHLNSLIAPEILHIKRDDVFNAVHIHRRNKPGVVDFEAGHSIGGDQALPFREDCRRLGKHGKEGFTSSHVPLGFRQGQTKTVYVQRPSGDTP